MQPIQLDSVFRVAIPILLATAACRSEPATVFSASKPKPYQADSVATSARRVGTVQGFSGPESVRYSRDQDVYFVSVEGDWQFRLGETA